MKLRIYHRPWVVAAIFVVLATMLASTARVEHGVVRTSVDALAWVYGIVALLSAVIAAWIWFREASLVLSAPERLLIVAPHQDDCVLMAGGCGVRNTRLGGTTHVVYLTQPADARIAETRRAEAVRAWAIAGVEESSLHHWSLVPAEGVISKAQVDGLAVALQQLVDDVRPTLVVVPLFEGGHLHHDIAHHVVTQRIDLPNGARLYACPEYSPYFSLWRTPHGLLSYLVRYASGGLMAYYAKAEGVGQRGMSNLILTPDELAAKRQMLRAFHSQHGDALALHQGYADRWLACGAGDFAATPFRYRGSRASLIAGASAVLPREFVQLLLPGQDRTIGCERGITDLSLYT